MSVDWHISGVWTCCGSYFCSQDGRRFGRNGSGSAGGVESSVVSSTAGRGSVSTELAVLASSISVGSRIEFCGSGDCSVGSGSVVGSDICSSMSTTAVSRIEELA